MSSEIASDALVGRPGASPDAASQSIYRNRSLWLLMVVSTLCILDRQIMNIVAESIKQDLHLSDTSSAR